MSSKNNNFSLVFTICLFVSLCGLCLAINDCSNVQDVFEKRGVSNADIHRIPQKDVTLRYCEVPPSGSCCSHNAEMKLAAYARNRLENSTRDSINKLSSILGNRATKFNDFFKDLLMESKKGFHTMFKQTYGVIYEQNSYVFSNLFKELESYYTRGKIDLAEAMDSFFNTLYQKMFTVLNAQYIFEDKYLECVSEYMKDLKPFGDVPEKLSIQIKRSFVATRTFAQALAAANEVAKNMVNVRPPAECTAALTKMSTCGVCNGQTEKPCPNFCLNVMKGCLHHYLELDNEWDIFVSWMEKVSERLLGPFNIVMVVEPINIKISEAIMNFQETGSEISVQVFQGCGKPSLGRRRRAAIFNRNSNADLFIDDNQEQEQVNNERAKRAANPGNTDNRGNRNSHEIKYEPMQFSRNEAIQNNHGRGNNRRGGNNRNSGRFNGNRNDNKEPELDKLIKDIRQKVKDSKKFWSNLPYTMCNNEDVSVATINQDNCWNGHAVDRYAHQVANQIEKNPEFSGSMSLNSRHTMIINQQLFLLKTTISHLRNAYNGNDVEWGDQEDTYYGSGSGSGDDDDTGDSGSGLGYVYPPVSRTSVHDQTTLHTIERKISHSDPNNYPVIVENEDSSETVGPDSTEDNEVHSKPEDKPDTGSSAPGTATASPWKLKRILITYFLPIIVTWLGGISTDLL